MLTPGLASGFMSLFTNCLPLEASLRVMDYFMLQKTEAIVSLAKQILKAQRKEIMEISENYQTQAYMVKTVYREALAKN
jgi:hypothetical protein